MQEVVPTVKSSIDMYKKTGGQVLNSDFTAKTAKVATATRNIVFTSLQ